MEGALTFVLHSHFPHVRNAVRWLHGEAMIHEPTAETYASPLNVPCALTKAINPAAPSTCPILLQLLSSPPSWISADSLVSTAPGNDSDQRPSIATTPARSERLWKNRH